jgi:phospholipid/cholesterol/gamma-HCH transport system substrate-binding protein
VELSGGGPNSARLAAPGPGRLPVIRTQPSLSARLENVLTTVLEKLDSTSTTINALLSPQNQAAVSQILADLSTVMHTVASRKATLDRGISSATQTFDNSAQLTQQLGPVIEQIRTSAESIERMGNAAAQASTSAGKTVDSVGADLQSFTRDALPELQRLMGNLDALATSLRRASERVERSPAGLLLGGSGVAPGPGESAGRGEEK